MWRVLLCGVMKKQPCVCWPSCFFTPHNILQTSIGLGRSLARLSPYVQNSISVYSSASPTCQRTISQGAQHVFVASGTTRHTSLHALALCEAIANSSAMHLLRSGVDINTIRAWLGHAHLRTTNIYAESDLDMKAKALAICEAPLQQIGRKRSVRKGIMGFLSVL